MELLMILPLCVMVMLSMFLWRLNRGDAPRTAVQTLLACSLFVYLTTEFISAFFSVSTLGFSFLWSTAAIILLGLNHSKRGAGSKTGLNTQVDIPSVWKTHNKTDRYLGCAIITILLGTLISGLLGTPNTCDALVYHIPRVLHWVQNGDVGFYATHIQRQLTHPPLLEYWFLQIWLFSGSDHFFNLVQWGSFVGCLALSVCFARAIKATGTGIRLSLLYTATLPVAVMQASSPKNDLFFAFHMWAFAYFLLLMIQHFSWPRALMAGVTLGLSLASKGTAFLFAPAIGLPLGIYWLCGKLPMNVRIKRLARLSAVALIGIILASPHMIRTYKHYGSISSSGSDSFTNLDYTPHAIFGNSVRMVASNFATPVPAINKILEQGLQKIVGRQLNNKGNIYLGETGRGFQMDSAPTETKMSNPFHMMVFILVCPLLVLRWRKNPLLGVISLCAVLVFMIFTILIQWSDWVTRYHITAFLMAAPLAGHLLGNRLEAWSTWSPRMLVCAGAAALAIFCSIFNVYRPILPFRSVSVFATPRYDQFFMYDNSPRTDQYRRKALMENIVKTSLTKASQVNGTKTIGLICSGSSTEYLWWKVADETSDLPVIFQQVYVDNVSGTFKTEKNLPDAIIIELKTPQNKITKVELDGFQKIATENDYMVYARQQLPTKN